MFLMIRWLKAQGYSYRGVDINIDTRDDEESVGEMHMKDYIDVSSSSSRYVQYIHTLWLKY